MEKNIHVRLFTSALSQRENRLIFADAPNLPKHEEVNPVIEEAAAVEKLVKEKPTLDQITLKKLESVRSKLNALQDRFRLHVTENEASKDALFNRLKQSENALDAVQSARVQAEKDSARERVANKITLRKITGAANTAISWGEWRRRYAIPEIKNQRILIGQLVEKRPYNLDSRIQAAIEQVEKIDVIDARDPNRKPSTPTPGGTNERITEHEDFLKGGFLQLVKDYKKALEGTGTERDAAITQAQQLLLEAKNDRIAFLNQTISTIAKATPGKSLPIDWYKQIAVLTSQKAEIEKMVAETRGSDGSGSGYFQVADNIDHPIALDDEEVKNVKSLAEAIKADNTDGQNAALDYWNNWNNWNTLELTLSESDLWGKAYFINAELDKDPKNTKEVVVKDGKLSLIDKVQNVPSVAPTEQQKTWLQEIVQMFKDWLNSILKYGADSGELTFMKPRKAVLDHEIKNIEKSPDYKNKDKKPALEQKIKDMRTESENLDKKIKAAEAKNQQACDNFNAQAKSANAAAPGTCLLQGQMTNGQFALAPAPGTSMPPALGQMIYIRDQLPSGTVTIDPRSNNGRPMMTINRISINRSIIGNNNSNINIGGSAANAGNERPQTSGYRPTQRTDAAGPYARWSYNYGRMHLPPLPPGQSGVRPS